MPAYFFVMRLPSYYIADVGSIRRKIVKVASCISGRQVQSVLECSRGEGLCYRS